MVELPQKLKQNYGLSAKSQFSRNPGPESSGTNLWTQTPNGSKPSSSKVYIQSSSHNVKNARALFRVIDFIILVNTMLIFIFIIDLVKKLFQF